MNELHKLTRSQNRLITHTNVTSVTHFSTQSNTGYISYDNQQHSEQQNLNKQTKHTRPVLGDMESVDSCEFLFTPFRSRF